MENPKKELGGMKIFRPLKQPSAHIIQWKLFKKTWFYFYQENGFGWFRLFGYGLHWKDTKRHDLLFSERYKHTKYIMLCGYLIKLLTPSK